MTTPRGPDTAEAPLAVPDRVVGWFELKGPALPDRAASPDGDAQLGSTAEDRIAAHARRGACVALVVAAITIVLALATRG
jgi:hypothetical protein